LSLKGVGRFLIFGVAGSALLALAWSAARGGAPRTPDRDRHVPWQPFVVPYVIVAVLGIILIALAAWRVSSGPARPSAASRSTRRQLMAVGTNGKRISRADLEAAFSR